MASTQHQIAELAVHLYVDRAGHGGELHGVVLEKVADDVLRLRETPRLYQRLQTALRRLTSLRLALDYTGLQYWRDRWEVTDSMYDWLPTFLGLMPGLQRLSLLFDGIVDRNGASFNVIPSCALRL